MYGWWMGWVCLQTFYSQSHNLNLNIIIIIENININTFYYKQRDVSMFVPRRAPSPAGLGLQRTSYTPDTLARLCARCYPLASAARVGLLVLTTLAPPASPNRLVTVTAPVHAVRSPPSHSNPTAPPPKYI
jgi:hypothetical protein